MNKLLQSIGLVALGGALLAPAAVAQTAAKLEAQDYIDIRQLIDGYSRVLENCTNGGNDYADLYTDDATFGVSSEWNGRGVKVWFRGRDALARAGGGDGKGGCRPPQPNPQYHIVTNVFISPAPGGAKATSTLLTITNKTDRARRRDPLGRRLRRHVREDRQGLALQVARARVARDQMDRPPRGHAAAQYRERVVALSPTAALGRCLRGEAQRRLRQRRGKQRRDSSGRSPTGSASKARRSGRTRPTAGLGS